MSTIKADNISPVGSTLNLTAPVAGLSVAGGLTVGGIAFFSGGVTFNSTSAFSGGVTFNSTTDHAGLARFASTSTFTGLVTLTGGATSAAVISCGTAPTQGQHLANKTYVDSFGRIGSSIIAPKGLANGTYTSGPWNGWTVESYTSAGAGAFSYYLTPPPGTTWFLVIAYRNTGNLVNFVTSDALSSRTQFDNQLSNTNVTVLWALRIS